MLAAVSSVTIMCFGFSFVLWVVGLRGAFLLALPPIVGLTFGGLVALTESTQTAVSARAALDKIDRDLVEARRLQALEAEVKEARRLLHAATTPVPWREEAGEEEADGASAPSTRRWREK